MKKVKGLWKGAAVLLAVVGLSVVGSNRALAASTTVTVSPASARAGSLVNVTFTVNPGNPNLAQFNYVVGFSSGSTPNCNVVWASPYACNFGGNGVINPTPFGSVAIPPNGLVTVSVRVPAGAPSGNIIVGYVFNCGTVQFADINTFCNTPDFWGAAPFTVIP